MTTQIKYLIFKGIEKKEQILFKSFLNLSKNELEYQVVILKPDQDTQSDTDIVIADVSYDFNDDERNLVSLPTIWVGDDINEEMENYIRRPAQWSEFKTALAQLDIEMVEEDSPVERVLPSDIQFAITEMPGEAETSAQDGEEEASENDYEYELGKMSIDYHSVTNSDYAKVADDVKQFNKSDDSQADLEPIILMTDDESASQNSVLVLETNTVDAWDFTQSESTVSEVESGYESQDNVDGDNEEVVLTKRVGLDIADDEEYWASDNEIIVNHETLLYFKPMRSMVYSSKEPGRWASVLKNNAITKLPLSDNWRPTKELKAYPISNFTWVNILLRNTQELADGLDEESEYMLEKWPDFDLIQLDNTLLKLCTMLFVRPESVVSLSSKSGYDRATIIGLINACYSVGLIKPASAFTTQQIVNSNAQEGMLGKIKDVFR